MSLLISVGISYFLHEIYAYATDGHKSLHDKFNSKHKSEVI